MLGVPLRLPESGKIRLPVQARRGCRQNSFAISRPGRARRGLIHPLRRHMRADDGNQERNPKRGHRPSVTLTGHFWTIIAPIGELEKSG